jgi:filamentous hemagglutinin
MKGVLAVIPGLGEWATVAEVGAFSAIGSTGDIGEQWLAENLGGDSQIYFPTTQGGGRYVDQLVGDVANESKVGYQSLTPKIQRQILKDAELLNDGTFQGVNWHFFRSPVTGLGGPSQPLLNELQQNGINVIIH